MAQQRRLPALALVAFCAIASACKDEAADRCRQLFLGAQAVVGGVDAGARDSVEASLEAVKAALEACKAAGLHAEVDRLTRARNELGAQVGALERRAAKRRRAQRTPAELAEIAKKGDPDCPRGMAYMGDDGERIRCIGPQPASMTLAQARRHYEDRGYKVLATENPPGLRIEYGAELLIFAYASAEGAAPPSCLVLYPLSEKSWEEAVAEVTGAPLRKLARDRPVPVGERSLELALEEGRDKLVVLLGSCAGVKGR